MDKWNGTHLQVQAAIIEKAADGAASCPAVQNQQDGAVLQTLLRIRGDAEEVVTGKWEPSPRWFIEYFAESLGYSFAIYAARFC